MFQWEKVYLCSIHFVSIGVRDQTPWPSFLVVWPMRLCSLRVSTGCFLLRGQPPLHMLSSSILQTYYIHIERKQHLQAGQGGSQGGQGGRTFEVRSLRPDHRQHGETLSLVKNIKNQSFFFFFFNTRSVRYLLNVQEEMASQ